MKALSIIILTIIILFVLSACTTVAATDRVVVVKPPAGLMKCEKAKLPDNPEKLTNRETVQTINGLVSTNLTCHENMNKVRTYVDESAKNYEKVTK